MSQLVIHHYTRPATRNSLWIGIAMSIVGLAYGIEQSAQWLAAHPLASRGLEASLMAGLATGLGAIPVLFLRRPQTGLMAPMLGLAGGMMFAASVFSLLVPAAQIVTRSASPWLLGALAVVAMIAGAAMMKHMDRRTAHVHVEAVDAAGNLPKIGLVVAAIALHNVPEGLAVGVSAAAGADHSMTIGIAIQNIPEGWIVASAMITLGAAPLRAALAALGTGLVEPVGGLFGVIASSLAGEALPLALAAAAGAMLWVVGHELIPAARQPGSAKAGTAGLVSGFVVMTALSAAF